MSPIRLRVTELRDAKGWSKSELARLSGVDRVQLHRIESGSTASIEFATLEKLADVFGVEPAYLIERIPKKRGR